MRKKIPKINIFCLFSSRRPSKKIADKILLDNSMTHVRYLNLSSSVIFGLSTLFFI